MLLCRNQNENNRMCVFMCVCVSDDWKNSTRCKLFATSFLHTHVDRSSFLNFVYACTLCTHQKWPISTDFSWCFHFDGKRDSTNILTNRVRHTMNKWMREIMLLYIIYSNALIATTIIITSSSSAAAANEIVMTVNLYGNLCVASPRQWDDNLSKSTTHTHKKRSCSIVTQNHNTLIHQVLVLWAFVHTPLNRMWRLL